MIIAIDGPAASGKSTTARALARHLGLVYLDTGAMYRALALATLRSEADQFDAAVADALASSEIAISHTADGEMRIKLNGEDVTEQIRQSEVGTMASRISARADVRRKMVALQRSIGRSKEEGIVLDGRDIGTVVFPDADIKVYLTADAEERARRRHNELAQQGEDVPFENVLRELNERDKADRERDVAPLKRASDAVTINTTELTIEEQVEAIAALVRAHTTA